MTGRSIMGDDSTGLWTTEVSRCYRGGRACFVRDMLRRGRDILWCLASRAEPRVRAGLPLGDVRRSAATVAAAVAIATVAAAAGGDGGGCSPVRPFFVRLFSFFLR